MGPPIVLLHLIRIAWIDHCPSVHRRWLVGVGTVWWFGARRPSDHHNWPALLSCSSWEFCESPKQRSGTTAREEDAVVPPVLAEPDVVWSMAAPAPLGLGLGGGDVLPNEGLELQLRHALLRTSTTIFLPLLRSSTGVLLPLLQFSTAVLLPLLQSSTAVLLPLLQHRSSTAAHGSSTAAHGSSNAAHGQSTSALKMLPLTKS
uniref:Uncharacterized protein n=2 Tax=Aegilops tauschii subsp. strangulata TaxID=200361 RepID=A0A453I440_AEGTS